MIDEALRGSVLAPYAARYADFDMVIDGHMIPAKVKFVFDNILCFSENRHIFSC